MNKGYKMCPNCFKYSYINGFCEKCGYLGNYDLSKTEIKKNERLRNGIHKK